MVACVCAKLTIILVAYCRIYRQVGTTLNVATAPPSTTLSTSSDNEPWTRTSWKNKVVAQPPNYQDENELKEAIEKLERCSPLVFAGEVRTLLMSSWPVPAVDKGLC